MGIINTKDMKRKIDEATSNSRKTTEVCEEMQNLNSLSNLRYTAVEKPKWNVFRKKEFAPIPTYATSLKPLRGCPCGNDGPCKQKITPKGVTIHYPQKKKKAFQVLTANRFRNPKDKKPIVNPRTPVKVIRQKKFLAWRVDRLRYASPYFKVRRAPFSQL